MYETRAKLLMDSLTAEHRYFTAKELSETLGLSEKVIRSEIEGLNEILKRHGASVQSIKGKGSIFIIENRTLFEQFLKKEWYRYAFFQPDFNNRQFRLENMLSLLLFSNSYIKQQELADVFYVSISQANKDIKQIRCILQDYHLQLESKPYYGMKVVGDEHDIRRCIKNELGLEESLLQDEAHKNLFETVQNIIDGVNKKAGTPLPYVPFKNLVIHVYIAILRVKAGQTLSIPEETATKIEQHKENALAEEIVSRLENELKLQIPRSELLYITVHWMTKNHVSDAEKISPQISKLVEKMTERIYQSTKIDLRKDLDFYFYMGMHLGPLIERVRYRLTLKNPLLEDIRREPIAFHLASIASGVINEEFHTTLTEDEIAYLALHIATAMNNREENKKSILIVCGSGRTTAMLMKSQLEKSFRGNIDHIDTLDFEQLEGMDVSRYDFVVSTLDIPNKLDCPVVYVDPIMKPGDFKAIQKEFQSDAMEEFLAVFQNSEFYTDVDIQSKEEVFERLASIIERRTGVPAIHLIHLLEERENMGSTAYDGEIAIPHLLTPVDDDSFAVIMILKSPIDWSGRRIRLILSLHVGFQQKNMEFFFQKLGEFMSSRNFIEQSMKSSTKDEFMNIVLGRENV